MTINRTHLAGLELALSLMIKQRLSSGGVHLNALASLEDAVEQAQAAPEAEPVVDVSGIGRDADHPRAVVLYLRTEPSDDDMRAIQNALRTAPQQDADHVEHPRAMVDAELVELRGLRPVLAMILNALDRDAAEGKAARGEMAEELRAKLATLSAKP